MSAPTTSQPLHTSKVHGCSICSLLVFHSTSKCSVWIQILKNIFWRRLPPAGAKNYEKFPLLVENGNMFIEVSCVIEGQSFKNKFLIHSGYSGAVLLDDRFVQENSINEKLPIVGEKILKDAYGNGIKTKKAICRYFRLAGRN